LILNETEFPKAFDKVKDKLREKKNWEKTWHICSKFIFS
jgi:hypothetical protein